MSYLTDSEFAGLTGRDASEATTERIRTASKLLDSRIGYRDRQEDGFKLDLDKLENYQKQAVQNWVAWMIASLFDTGDSPDTASRVSLGRFSVTDDGGEAVIPQSMAYADAELKDSGIIQLGIKTTKYEPDIL